MKIASLIASGLFAVALGAVSLPAQALTAKECSAKYQAAKAAGTLNGMKWNDFRKAECGGEAPAAAPPPAAETKPAPEPKTATTPAAKPATGGRAAMIARERACGAEWKTMKAEGKRPAGMKWPQFWHECDVRMKAEGK